MTSTPTCYLLPCRCGKTVPVQPRQAGQTVFCTCGASLEVPTLLEMEALEKMPPAEESPRYASQWGIRQRLILSGVALMVVAAGPLLYLLRSVPEAPRFDPEHFDRQLRGLSAVQMRQLWQTLRKGPDERPLPQEKDYEEALFQHRLWLALAGCGVFAGAVLCAMGGLVKGSQDPLQIDEPGQA